jgi:hypothetical protein
MGKMKRMRNPRNQGLEERERASGRKALKIIVEGESRVAVEFVQLYKSQNIRTTLSRIPPLLFA